MSKARELAELGNAYSDGALSNRSLIINGAMQVAQRGTSFTANGYGIDRYITYNSGGTATLTQEALAAGDSLANSTIHYYMRVVRSSPSGIYYISNKIEDVKTASGQSVTLSFYARASASVSLGARLTQDFGLGGSTSFNTAQQSVTLTTSFARYTMTFDLPSVSGKTIGANSNLQVTFDVPASTETFDITGVQLEVGDTATPFEHKSFDQEHLLCQRYFQRFGAGATSGRMGVGAWSNSTSTDIIVHLTHEMRAVPTVTAVQGGRVLDFAVSWHDVTSLVGVTESTTKAVNLNLSNTSQPSAASQGDVAALGGGGAPFDYWFDAEL